MYQEYKDVLVLSGYVRNCYNVGIVEAQDSQYQVKGVAEDATNVENCYYNAEIIATTNPPATGLTTAYMKSTNFLNDLGSRFKKVNGANNDYPVLVWEQFDD